MAPVSSLLLSLSLFSLSVLADPRMMPSDLTCGNRTARNRTDYIPNFLAALDAVTPQITSRRVARFISGNGTADRVFAFGQCHKDLSQSDCDLCFAVCKTEILRCTPFQRMVTEGRLFLGGCYLRYDDYNFFGEIASPMDRLVCNRSVSVGGNSTGFVHEAKGMLRNLPNLAVGNNRFWRGNVGNGDSTVFAIGQCWDTMNASTCGTCLNNAAVKVQSCLPAGEGRFMGSGCYLRYTNYKFYNDSIAAPPSQSNAGSRKFATIFAVCSSVLVVVMVVIGVIYFTLRKIETKRREKRQLGNLAATVKKSALNFKYELLERATNYFDQANKLGQGGSGSVYKGTLADGKEIAIKRLFFNTRQWVDEFFNEVNLISGIEHKNLVKLLGCSITGPESLLVYEYVPNKSVDRVLFDAENTQRLTWEMRLNIVMGTAEGLAYLHEGCQLRIIHRDIKLSNVLLDEEFNAKIADFGLVRCFPQDKTHISTGIAGTLGYMAPEYLVRGKLTEKADIYSFGILLIEIITGRRIIAHYKNMNSSLHLVWNLYVSNRLVEAMDPKIEGNFSKEDVEHVLKVGLLCTQASADLRPPMSRVLRMLSGVDYVLPSPTQPPFINSSASDQEFPYPGSSQSQHDSRTHSSTNSTPITILEAR